MSSILLIDDDPIIRKMGQSYFTAKGHSVMVAKDGSILPLLAVAALLGGLLAAAGAALLYFLLA